MNKLLATVVIAGALTASAANALAMVTVEAPGVTNTTMMLASSGVETFDGLSLGLQPLVTTFGGSPFIGTYSAINVRNADQYGGAGGTLKYAQILRASTLKISGAPVDYFGAFASALDGRNTVSFYKAGVLIDSFNSTAAAASLPAAYSGNPGVPFLKKDFKEKFAFFNFHVIGGYDEVRLVRNGGGGFESDNHTVGNVAIVPEPGTWALMVAGFGLVGFGMRRRKKTVVYA